MEYFKDISRSHVYSWGRSLIPESLAPDVEAVYEKNAKTTSFVVIGTDRVRCPVLIVRCCGKQMGENIKLRSVVSI